MITDDGSRIMQEQEKMRNIVNLASETANVEIHDSKLLSATSEHELHPEKLSSYYEIEKCADIIVKNNFKHIALQFPDELLPDATGVYFALHEAIEKRMSLQQGAGSNLRTTPASTTTTSTPIDDIEDFEKSTNQHGLHYTGERNTASNALASNETTMPELYILGDTSYGSCCVDEIAGQHVDADFIIHYGNACLQPVKRSPVYHVFGTTYTIDIETCIDSLKSYASQAPSVPTVVLYDLVNARIVDQIKNRLSLYTEAKIIYATVRQDRVTQNMPQSSILAKTAGSASSGEVHEINGLEFTIPEGVEDFQFFFLGEESVRMTQVMIEYNTKRFAKFSAVKNTLEELGNNTKINRLLKRRYFLIHQAREANIFGILVATLTVANYMQIVEYTKQLIESKGKKTYTFYVGKLNIPKLANFAEIDMFVLIGCGSNTLIDSKEFYKPIITPYELDIALKEKQWMSTGYVTDFNKLLKSIDSSSQQEEQQPQENEGVEYSFVRGTLIDKPQVSASHQQQDPSSMSLVSASEKEKQMIIAKESPALFLLKQRTYQGLDQKLGETAVAQIEEGRSGIASGYSHENEHKNSS